MDNLHVSMLVAIIGLIGIIIALAITHSATMRRLREERKRLSSTGKYRPQGAHTYDLGTILAGIDKAEGTAPFPPGKWTSADRIAVILRELNGKDRTVTEIHRAARLLGDRSSSTTYNGWMRALEHEGLVSQGDKRGRSFSWKRTCTLKPVDTMRLFKPVEEGDTRWT